MILPLQTVGGHCWVLAMGQSKQPQAGTTLPHIAIYIVVTYTLLTHIQYTDVALTRGAEKKSPKKNIFLTNIFLFQNIQT